MSWHTAGRQWLDKDCLRWEVLIHLLRLAYYFPIGILLRS